MRYRLPTKNDYEILKEYAIEHYSNGEKGISASLDMTNMNYDIWVEKINRNSQEADDEWGKYYLYLVFNDNNRLVGLLNNLFRFCVFIKNAKLNTFFSSSDIKKNSFQ